MRISRIKSPWTAAILSLLAGLAGVTFPCFAEPNASTTGLSASVEAQPPFSPGIRDILKMVDAKVDQAVIITYIKNSPIPYSLTATEIIALKQRGVPDELIATVVEHGGEVRMQIAQAMAQSPSAAPSTPQYSTGTPQYSYGSDYGAGPSYWSSPAYADYGYGYGYPYYNYPYYYGYPYGYSYGYWPWFYSPFFFGFHGHHGFDHNHNGHFHDGHFHDGHSFAVHNGAAGHGGAWAPASRGMVHRPFAGQNGFAGHSAFAGRSGFSGRPMAFSGARVGGFAGRSGGFAMRSGGGGFAGHSGGFGGGHGGGGHGGGHR